MAGKHERVVVVFDDQLTNLPANRAHRHARQASATAMQKPLVAQLKQVGATHITTLSLLNAVAATMPAAEAKALSRTRGVEKVVPDGTIIIGQGASNPKTVAASRVRKSRFPARAADGQRICSAFSGKPLLEPEALSLIHVFVRQSVRPLRSIQDRDWPGRHRRERRRQLAGWEPQPDPA